MGADITLLIASASLVAKHRGRPVSNEQPVVAIAHNQPQPCSYQSLGACLCEASSMTGHRAASQLASNSLELKSDCTSCHRS